MIFVAVLPTIPPGLIVQFPAGRPESSTLPVARVQVGCVIVPTTGAGGAPAAALITTSAETSEVQPEEFVTVKLCVPAVSPMMVFVAVFPVAPTGLIVQSPAGSPESTTLPVDKPQVGCVMVPITGAAGVRG